MAIVSKTTLKGYFNNGDVPIEQNYIDLIDTVSIEGHLHDTEYHRKDAAIINSNDIRMGGGIIAGRTDVDPPTGVVRSEDYMIALGGLHVGGESDPGTDALLVDGNATITGGTINIGADCNIYRNAANQLKTDDSFWVNYLYSYGNVYCAAPGNFDHRVNGIDYQGYIFVPLTTPLTSTAWDGDLRSDTTATLIDLSAVFGVPANAKAVLCQIIAKDSSWRPYGDLYVGLGPSATYWYQLTCRPVGSVYYESGGSGYSVVLTAEAFGPVSCDANGDIYFAVNASGAGTMEVHLRIWGYWI